MKTIILLTTAIIILIVVLFYAIANNQKEQMEVIIKDNLTQLKEFTLEISSHPIVQPGEIYALGYTEYEKVIKQLKEKGVNISDADLISYIPNIKHLGLFSYHTIFRHVKNKAERDIYIVYTNVNVEEQFEIIKRERE